MTELTWTDPAYETITLVVGARTGLAFQPHSRPNVESQIQRAMARVGHSELTSYGKLIAADAKALDDLVIELTVGETYFFREPAQFDFIRQEILPELRRRDCERAIRGWSAGCASGEEAYSLAMLFEQVGLSRHSSILATDISRAALDKARQATYRDWSLRGDGADGARRFLIQTGDTYRVEERICRRVAIEYLNLALDVYPSVVTGTWGLDLILCRNVLIYFDRQTICSVARRFYDALSPGGWLITASTDPSLDEHAPFETVVTETGVFYRHTLSPAEQPSRAPLKFAGGGNIADTPIEIRDSESEIRCPKSPSQNLTARFDDAEPKPPLADPLVDARQAIVDGDYVRAVALTRGHLSDQVACALHIQALANLDMIAAEQASAEATRQHPLSAQLYYLRAVLLLEGGCDVDAAEAARRVVYLDHSLALAHFTLGSILRRLGDIAGAQRSFRNARDLCAARPPDEHVPLSDGELAGRLVQAAEAQMHCLSAAEVIQQ